MKMSENRVDVASNFVIHSFRLTHEDSKKTPTASTFDCFLIYSPYHVKPLM